MENGRRSMAYSYFIKEREKGALRCWNHNTPEPRAGKGCATQLDSCFPLLLCSSSVSPAQHMQPYLSFTRPWDLSAPTPLTLMDRHHCFYSLQLLRGEPAGTCTKMHSHRNLPPVQMWLGEPKSSSAWGCLPGCTPGPLQAAGRGTQPWEKGRGGCGSEMSLCIEHSLSHPRYSTEMKEEAAGSGWQAGKMEVTVLSLWKDTGKWLGRCVALTALPATTVSQFVFPSLLPTTATHSTEQLKAASRAKMQSITKHNSLFNEKAGKDSSLGQNMNHQKTTLAEIPIKGNVNNHPSPLYIQTPLCSCAGQLYWVECMCGHCCAHKCARAWKVVIKKKKKSEKNTRIILDRRTGAGNL